jgi:dCTP deaminase
MSNNILFEANFSHYQNIKNKIERLKRQRLSEDLLSPLEVIVKYLENKIRLTEDIADFISLAPLLTSATEFIDIFLEASPENESHWAKSLIKECYRHCNINNNRKILIIHKDHILEYMVQADVFDILPGEIKTIIPKKPIVDVFMIPGEAKFDLVSIAIVGHEVGHIAWEPSIIEANLDEISTGLEKLMMENIKEPTIETFINLKVYFDNLRKRLASHVEEYFCDSIGRILLGPAFDISLIKNLLPFLNNSEEINDSHPPEITRIQNSLTKLKEYKPRNEDFLGCLENIYHSWFALLEEYLDDWKKITKENSGLNKENENAKTLAKIAEENFSKKMNVENYSQKRLDEIWEMVVPELDAFRPPVETVSREKPRVISPFNAIVGTLAYYFGDQYAKTNEFFNSNKESEEEKIRHLRNKLIEHLKYAITIYDFVRSSNEKHCGNFEYIEKKLDATLWEFRTKTTGGKNNPFVVIPTIDPVSQYGQNSVDLRLGSTFLVHRPTRYTHIPTKPKRQDVPLEIFYDKIFMPVGGEDFILHPHQFVLATTLEYVSLPYDYYALVLGRSTWGRLGLNIATATTVQAGFRGCLTLELRNLGETPLPLTIGTRIAQICLIKIPEIDSQKGYYAGNNKYVGPTGPEYPKIYDDQDWDTLSYLKT